MQSAESNIIGLPLGQQDANSFVTAAQDGSEDIEGTAGTFGGVYELDGAQVRIFNPTGNSGPNIPLSVGTGDSQQPDVADLPTKGSQGSFAVTQRRYRSSPAELSIPWSHFVPSPFTVRASYLDNVLVGS